MAQHLEVLGWGFPEPALRLWLGFGSELDFCAALRAPVVQETP